jgi:integrase
MASITPYETAAGKRYRVRYRKPDNSQTDKRGFKTKREAELFLASVEVSKAKGEWVDPTLSRATVEAWSPTWLASHSDLKPSTRAAYEWILTKYILPQWGSTPLVAVTHAGVQGWVTQLGTSYAPSTVRKIHVIFSGLMNYAVRDRRIPRNPCDDVRLPRIKGSDRAYLSHDQVAELAALAKPYDSLVFFLAYTGLRWGEMAALKVKRVDMLRRRLDVAEAITEVGGVVVWGTPKNHERRSVPFPSFLVDMLAAQCEGKGREDPLFTTERGMLLRSSNFRNTYFNPAALEFGERHPEIPKVTPHALRHTAASLAISAGASVLSVQRMLGHASAAMTLDVYSDLFDDDLDAVASALDDKARQTDVGKTWARTS